MSEYQYYEFQALDRPLTPEAQKELRRLSSRVQLTATSASFVYSYSDFPGDSYQLLRDYFDAMLYITNWGSRQLMLRFPAAAIPAAIQRQYQFDTRLHWSPEDPYLILNIDFYDEEGGGGEWVEGQGLLPGLIAVRDELLRGDFRALYLAWLKIAHYESDMLEDDEDLTEPLVPPNLGRLSSALQNFIEFFELDRDLVTAAAQASPTATPVSENLSGSLDLLPEAEKRDFLLRLLRGEAYLDIKLTNRLRALAPAPAAPEPAGERRTIRQLLATAQTVEQQRKAQERREAEAQHRQHLEQIAHQEAQLWARLPDLIAQKQGSAYDEAVKILVDLRDLAQYQQRLPQFQEKMKGIQNQYPTLSGLQRRFKEARLV